MIFCLFASQDSYEYIKMKSCLILHQGGVKLDVRIHVAMGTLLHPVMIWCYGNMLDSLPSGSTRLLMKPQAVCVCVCVCVWPSPGKPNSRATFTTNSPQVGFLPSARTDVNQMENMINTSKQEMTVRLCPLSSWPEIRVQESVSSGTALRSVSFST